jgi:hypothetical protein
MLSLKRKRNLLDDKQKREIINYAKENQNLTQQQIADNFTIKFDLPIKRRTVGNILNKKEFHESDNSSPKCFAFSFKISSVNGTFLDLAFANQR